MRYIIQDIKGNVIEIVGTIELAIKRIRQLEETAKYIGGFRFKKVGKHAHTNQY